ncbi:MAG: hypothetical protein AAF658_05970 [Myxococcota bacterium]
MKPIVVILGLVALCACASPVKNRNPVGEAFPSVRGNALSGERYRLPEDLAGQPTLLLVAYDQGTQFDVDRWLLGLLQSGIELRLFEVPTIEGWVPGLLETTIDDGMRAGIPDEDESLVITVYDDAEQIVRFTGNERKRNARAILLDAEGRVRWFHDEGYSARVLLELLKSLESG